MKTELGGENNFSMMLKDLQKGNKGLFSLSGSLANGARPLES